MIDSGYFWQCRACLVETLNANAIDLVELAAAKLGFGVYRLNDNEVSLVLSNEKVKYLLFVEVRRNICEALYFSCDTNIRAPMENYQSAAVAVVKANEHSLLGHFDIISSNYRIVYSLTVPFVSTFNFDELNMEAILSIIQDECDKFRQYFVMTMDNKGEMSDSSINALFFEALGEA